MKVKVKMTAIMEINIPDNVDQKLTEQEIFDLVEDKVRYIEIGDRIESGDLYDDGRMIVLYSIDKNCSVEKIETYGEDTLEFAYNDSDIEVIK